MSINWTSALWAFILFVLYLGTSSIGLYLIKSASDWKTTTFVIGFILYSGGAVIWMAILRLFPLSFAFPIAAGGLVICTMATGMLFLNESITTWRIFGAFMIIAGIVLIAR